MEKDMIRMGFQVGELKKHLEGKADTDFVIIDVDYRIRVGEPQVSVKTEAEVKAMRKEAKQEFLKSVVDDFLAKMMSDMEKSKAEAKENVDGAVSEGATTH